MNAQQNLSITVPIAAEFRTVAEQIAAPGSTGYWKTIAALAVSEYLQWQGYEVRSDFVERALTDDVWIAGVGRIGYLNVSGGEPFELRAEMQDGRVGSIVLTCEEKRVRLWGFLSLIDPEDLPEQVEWSEVQSLDEMIGYFDRLDRGSQNQQLQEFEPDEFERLMLVAQLERIYRSERRNRWGIRAAQIFGIRAAQILAEEEREVMMTREAKLPEDLTERQALAEQMMQGLAEVWSNEGGLV